MNFKMLLLIVLPLSMFANEASSDGGTDFWWRLVNFIIFAIIIYRLVAGKIAEFFKNRERSIADELSSIQEKIKEAKAKKQEAQNSANDAVQKASELKEIAKKEAELIAQKILQQTQLEKEMIEKSFEQKVDIERKKMKESVVSEVVEDIFSTSGGKISTKELLNIIKKKVA